MKWEYTIGYSGSLDEEGQAGWEAVGIIEADETGFSVLMKRPVVEILTPGTAEAGERGSMTRDAILALRTEAAAAGDTQQVAVCDAALDRDPHALAECARVIADAAAQDD